MSNNIDNLLGDIYSSNSQSQGVKELANLINNLSQLLLKSISQLEIRVSKMEQQISGGAGRAPQPSAPNPLARATPAAPKPAVASPFSAPVAPKATPPPPPARAKSAAGGPVSASQAASMLGVTLKKTPTAKPAAQPVAQPASSSSGPSFLTSTVNASAPKPATAPTSGGLSPTPDAAAPVSTEGGPGVAGPRGGFRGELAEKLARRRQKVQKQIDDDFDSPDLEITSDDDLQDTEEESASSELKVDLEDELRSAFSKLKG
ncbi:MAG: hypothetical protein ACTSQB_04740 [Candidatus Heimdallarchaeota archaeon]